MSPQHSDSPHFNPVTHGARWLDPEPREDAGQTFWSGAASLGLMWVGFPLAMKGIGAGARILGGAGKAGLGFAGKAIGSGTRKMHAGTSNVLRQKWANLSPAGKRGVVGGSAAAVGGAAAGVEAMRRRKARGLPSDHLGATGDLTIGLHHAK